MPGIVAGLLFLAQCSAQAISTVADTPILLTTARQVHDLPPNQVAKARVQIAGVVTYYDPLEQNLFVQDETGAVYIETDKSYPLHYGDYVSVNGTAMVSYRTQVALNPEIKVLAPHRGVQPLPVTYQELATGQMDCRLVRLSGIVRAINVEYHERVPIPPSRHQHARGRD